MLLGFDSGWEDAKILANMLGLITVAKLTPSLPI